MFKNLIQYIINVFTSYNNRKNKFNKEFDLLLKNNILTDGLDYTEFIESVNNLIKKHSVNKEESIEYLYNYTILLIKVYDISDENYKNSELYEELSFYNISNIYINFLKNFNLNSKIYTFPSRVLKYFQDMLFYNNYNYYKL